MSLNVESGRYILALNSWVSFHAGVVVVGVSVIVVSVYVVVVVVVVVVVAITILEFLVIVSQCMRLPFLKGRLDKLLLFNCLLLRCHPLN